MTPEEMIEAYNVVAEDARQQTADAAGKIGNSQRSLGLMAERVASPSGQTSGLANYTYNRTLRPTVETTATALQAQGHAQALQKYLDDELRKAKNAYEDAQNAMTVAQSTPTTTNSGNQGNYEEADDKSVSSDGSEKVSPSTPKRQGTSGTNDVINSNTNPVDNSQQTFLASGGNFTYVLNGETYNGYIYQGGGSDLPFGSFINAAATKAALERLERQGAKFYDKNGNQISPDKMLDLDYSIK